ncbi:MAG TPA: hypothetical protein VIB79_01095 [Candidatus Binatia bacterium]|jgi:hypothetical protein
MERNITFVEHDDCEANSGPCDYSQLAEMIAQWLRDYEAIQPLIEQCCNRSAAPGFSTEVNGSTLR